MTRRLQTTAFALCLLAQQIPYAAAQESVVPARYDAAIGEAVAEFSAGHWPEARALFSEAHSLYPNARTLRGLGMVAFELRNYVEARSMLNQALASEENPLSGDLRQKAEALLARANTFVGLFTVEAPEGTMLAVDGSSPSFDEDGRLVVNSGMRVISVVLPSGEQQRRPIDVRGGEIGTLVFEPEASSAGPAMTTGEGARGEGLPAGPGAGADKEIRGSAALNVAPWALTIGGGALVAASLVTGAMALSAEGDLEDGCVAGICPESLRDTRDRANTLAVVTDVLWIGGALAAAAGVTWLIIDGASDDTAQASVSSLSLAAGPASLLLEGSF